MTAALVVEPARTPEAYHRFYARVLDELGITDETTTAASPGPERRPVDRHRLGL